MSILIYSPTWRIWDVADGSDTAAIADAYHKTADFYRNSQFGRVNVADVASMNMHRFHAIALQLMLAGF